MSSLPIFLKSAKQHVLIVGAGEEAMAKLALVLESGCSVTVVGEGAERALAEAGLDGRDRLVAFDRTPDTADLDGKTLVYIGDTDETIEAPLLAAAKERGLPVNVVDQPSKCSFITPAQFRRGPIEVAFSSGGAAPVFIRRLRAALERIVSPSFGTLASAAGKAKYDVKARIPDATARRSFWDGLIDRAASFDGLLENEAIARIIEEAESGKPQTGLVQLVGAGPGDPDLLTLKAHRALQEADVILYDRLVSEEVLSLARRDASRIYVGKREGEHGIGQDGIQALMIERAQAGERVVRLKSGDPLMFARAGEELKALRDAGIEIEIVPGITALAGSAARAQIPVTDRDWSSALTLVTGKTATGETYSDYARLAGEGRTLAVYMGLRAAGKLSAGLIAEGVSASTPVTVIENATRPEERRFCGRLATLANLIADNDVLSPALILIGDVVQVGADWPNFLETEGALYVGEPQQIAG